MLKCIQIRIVSNRGKAVHSSLYNQMWIAGSYLKYKKRRQPFVCFGLGRIPSQNNSSIPLWEIFKFSWTMRSSSPRKLRGQSSLSFMAPSQGFTKPRKTYVNIKLTSDVRVCHTRFIVYGVSRETFLMKRDIFSLFLQYFHFPSLLLSFLLSLQAF